MSNSSKQALLDDLFATGNAEQAKISAGYLKTSDLSFIGIKLPVIATIAKKHMKGLDENDLVELMKELWKEPYYEARRASIDVMKEFVKSADVHVAFDIIIYSKNPLYVKFKKELYFISGVQVILGKSADFSSGAYSLRSLPSNRLGSDF